MRFLIIGPGAMGCLFSARLKRAGFNVILLDHNRERADELNRQGIMVEGISGEYTVKVPVVTGGVKEGFDAALICVKSYRTREAGETLLGLLSHETAVITLQNGVGNVEILEGIFGRDRVLGGITAEGATVLGSGRIRHAGRGATVIGPKERAGGVAEGIASALNASGFSAETTDNIEGLLWGKLIVNAGINALTAVTGLKNGRLPELRGTGLIMEDLVKEAVAVSRARAIMLPYDDPLGRVREVCRATAENVSSMLQDVINGKETEIDYINGAIVRAGEASGVPTPTNRILVNLVKAIEEGRHRM